MATTTDSSDTSGNTASESNFVTVPGDRRSEVGRTLAEPVPQSLGLLDQFGLWGNLGVSLLGFTGAIFVLQPGGAGTPELSLAAALTAIVAGTLLGTAVLALSGIPGAQTGAPAMVLLRGLFGARLSYLPTGINILQLVGWGIFELVTIATAAHTIAPALPRWGYVLIAGLIMGFAVIGAAYTKDINVAVAWITIAVAGISFHAPVGWSIPALIAPNNSTGQVGGIMNFLNNVAGFFAPTITGIIVARTGSFHIALITAAVILIVGIFSYVVILGRIDKIPEPRYA